MTGLKSGSGDDLWGDDEENEDEDASEVVTETSEREPERTEGTAGAADAADANATESDGATADEPEPKSESASADGDGASGGASVTQPYIVRRAVRDKSVQFERDERLTFFVHDDVADGERELLTELESALGRDVPKFDVREAVYRAALRNPDDVLDELLDMGYALDGDRE